MATDTLTPERRADRSKQPRGGLFRAFWRWHFYAAFVVVPILLVLATTGLIYLLRFQLEPLMHADVMKVERPVGVSEYVPYEDQRAAVAKAYPDATIASMTEPKGDDRSTDFYLSLPDGSSRDAYVDP